jgi:glycosyltransferase involved in cell wall biosynthesis/O-antigen/teichoic acid export membrane protein
MTGRYRTSSVEKASGVRSAPTVVVAATGVTSLLNYSFSLILLWALPPREYAVVASVTALLLLFGTVAGSSAPWVLAREVAVSAMGSDRRQRGLAFAGMMGASQAIAAALVCVIIVSRYADWQTTATASGAAIIIFIACAATGYLQGTERFNAIYALRIGEALVKIAISIVLVESGMAAWGAVSGFAFGALLVLFVSAFYMRDDALKTWRSRREPQVQRAMLDRALWASSAGIIGIQVGTAVMAGLDTIIASIMLSGEHGLATYQVVQILGRVPFFVAAALAVIVFPRMARSNSSHGMTVASSLRVWTRVCGASAVIMATLPPPILALILPPRYDSVSAILPWAAVTGFVLGGINLVTTYWQAIGRCRSPMRLLTGSCLLSAAADVLSLRGDDIRHLAWAASTTSMVGLCGLLIRVKNDWPGSFRGMVREVAIVAVPGAALVLLRGHLVIWLCVVVMGLGIPALRSLYLYGLTLAGAEKPRVLHLAFEDPCRPGSGGGSVRTREIDSRLGCYFKVTVVCARYRGCRPRAEDGVRYVHIGMPWGQKLSLVSYFLFLPWALMRYPSELVVEDFAAPFSSVAVPWLTSRPVVGVVQWLFAREKAAEYGLPFQLVERLGLSSHRHLVAVSEDLGAELRQRNPRAQVAVIENALPDEAFIARAQRRRNILYLGRLEVAQKGVDLLVQSFASIAFQVDRTLTVAGSGPDEARIRSLVDRLGIRDRVFFAGQVNPIDRFELLASAEVVAMPSRYETFGMVAAEALAVGTPIVAFDIPCLRSIVAPAGGILIPPFDTDAFAAALVRLLNDDQLRAQLGNAGRAAVRHLRWDGMAAMQQDFYSHILVET